jgi:hypothetical protein
MQIKYQRKPLSNMVRGVPDPARLDGLALKLLQREGAINPSPELIKQGAARLALAYRNHVNEVGMCAGMICNWALNYMSSGDPESVHLDAAQLLQGEMMMTGFKRMMMDKDHAVSVAEKKMFLNKGMFLTTVAKNQLFPSKTVEFKLATVQMLNWIELADNVPFVLTVSLGSVKHAIGLLCYQGSYYIVEPNHGIYKFEDRDIAVREMTNHFISTGVPPSSPWKLKAIGDFAA